MQWVSVKERLPDHDNEVLVSDGYEEYTVAWYNQNTKKWYASTDMLTADNYDDSCSFHINETDIQYWTEIECPTKEG